MHRPNFDSVLCLGSDRRGYGVLEIQLRTEVRHFDPVLAPGQFTVAMTPVGGGMELTRFRPCDSE